MSLLVEYSAAVLTKLDAIQWTARPVGAKLAFHR